MPDNSVPIRTLVAAGIEFVFYDIQRDLPINEPRPNYKFRINMYINLLTNETETICNLVYQKLMDEYMTRVD
jgi:hypothetical protein